MKKENQNKNFETFFNPGSIAIIGATDGAGKVGTVITRNILKLGYQGKVFLVNPTRKELYGKKCYAKLEDIEENMDLAVVIIPAGIVPEVVKNGAHKAKNFVIVSAGFGESGPEGKKRELELSEIAAEKNISILGPNCLGFIIPRLRLNATFAGGMPKRGNIGFITQSGALAVALLDIFEKCQPGFSGIFSIGNKMQVDESDLIEYLGNDANTKVIGLYLEGVKNGQKFINITKKISRIKPLVILKTGKTREAQKAITSHTGVLVGSDSVADAVFEKCGIIRANDLDQFTNLLQLLSCAKVPKNDLVAIVTNAGGGGVLATDAFKDKKIKLAGLSKGTKDKLRLILPEAASVTNPIDVLGDAHEDRFENSLSLLNGEEAGSVLCILTPQEQTPVEKIAEKIIEFSRKTDKTILTSFIGGEKIRESVNKMNSEEVTNFEYPEKAIGVLDKYFIWGNNQKKLEIKHEPNLIRIGFSKKIINCALKERRKALFFSEAKKIMDLYGIKVVDTWNLHQAVNIKYPAVLKIDSDRILHKTDKKGVFLGIKNYEELKRESQKLKSYFPGTNIIIQPMSSDHQELIVGFKRDETFGPVIAFGLGGIYTEVFKMINFAVPPLDVQEARELIGRSKISVLFGKNRGMESYDVEELAGIISKTGFIARENPDIKELDINPLFVYNNGRRAEACDIKIII